MSRWYETKAREIATQHGVPPGMVLAIALVESGAETNQAVAYRFEPGFWRTYLADNPEYQHSTPERVSASYGIMQVMYPTAREHGYRGEPEGLCNPDTNLTIACKVLLGLYKWAGSWGKVEAIVAAYNGGRGVGRTGPYKGKQAEYIAKYYRAFKQVGG